MSNALDLFKPTEETLTKAVEATRTREYYSALRRVAVARGCTASPRPPRARRRSRPGRARRSRSTPRRRRRRRRDRAFAVRLRRSASPTRASTDVDALLAAARAGMKAWRDAGPEARVGVCIEILDRLHARVFELANAVQHTSGQAFVMAFQAGGAHALDRALEAIAYAWVEMTRTPRTAVWEKPGKVPLTDGEDVHRRAARRGAGDRLQHVPDLELLAGPLRVAGDRQPGRRQAAPVGGAAARDHRAGRARRCWPRPASTRTWSRSPPRTRPTSWPRRSRVRPEVKLIDFTGGNAFGDWLEKNATQATVFTEKAGVNTVVIDSTVGLHGPCAPTSPSRSRSTPARCAPRRRTSTCPAAGIETDDGHEDAGRGRGRDRRGVRQAARRRRAGRRAARRRRQRRRAGRGSRRPARRARCTSPRGP